MGTNNRQRRGREQRPTSNSRTSPGQRQTPITVGSEPRLNLVVRGEGGGVKPNKAQSFSKDINLTQYACDARTN